MPGERLRVIINDRCLRNARTGVGHYVAELLAALRQAAPNLDILPFFQRYAGIKADGPTACVAASSSAPRRTAGWLRDLMQSAYELAFESVGAAKGYRLYHEPNHIPGPWQGPIITTVHDLSVLRHPEWHPPDRVRWYEREFLTSLPRSEHFITVSEFTRQEMIDCLDVAPERITAIHLGVRSVFQPRRRHEVDEWLSVRGLPARYLLFVGTMEPRKNVEGLLAAYARLDAAERIRFPLLLAGAGGWGFQSLQDLLARHGLTGDARPLGYVPDAQLAWLYAGATALVWPSLYEGFGLPPLECMATGTPVITSRVSSLPEVVGDAGIGIDPCDTSGLAEAMLRIIHDPGLAAELSRRGLDRARAFSWETCAARHAGLYERHGRQ